MNQGKENDTFLKVWMWMCMWMWMWIMAVNALQDILEQFKVYCKSNSVLIHPCP